MNTDRKHSILIVDDDPDDRESIREAFLENRYHGHEYIFFAAAEELMGYLHGISNEGHPALILLDLNMPGMTGKDALQEIKSSQKLRHIPIVIMTTSSSWVDKQASYRLGANCFVTKPDTFNKLVDITDSIAKLWVA
jgi:CheY-like chemotaxis protein